MEASKILLVLDDPSADEIKNKFESLGYHIVGCVTDGIQAINLASELHPDLALVGIEGFEDIAGIETGVQLYRHYDIPTVYFLDQIKTTTFPDITEIDDPFGYLLYPAEDKRILATIEIALARHQVEKQVAQVYKKAVQIETIAKAATQLNAHLDIQAIMETACSIIQREINDISTSVFYYDKNQEFFINMAHIGFLGGNNNSRTETDIKISKEWFCRFLSPTHPVFVVEDIHALATPDFPYIDLIHEQNLRSLAGAGLFTDDGIIGALVIKSRGEERKFTNAELELLKALADQTVNAVVNAFIFSQVQASRERQQLLAHRLADVQEDERRMLARELHDQIGQTLTGLQFSLKSLMDFVPEEKKEVLENAQKMVSAVIAQTRDISISLHPAMLDDMGLQLTLLWHFDQYTSQTGIQVDFHQQGAIDQRFDSNIELAVFRIIQEALTNVARYAKVESVHVELNVHDELIQVLVIDQGEGFNLEKVDKRHTLGLYSIRERAAALGGLVSIHSAPQQGTRIQADIPLKGMLERRRDDRNHLVG